MRVLNVHKRVLSLPKHEVAALLKTLSTADDRIWPYEKWPAMKFKEGLKVGSKGGNGPIRYTVEKYDPDEMIRFRFSRPQGFHGSHTFELKALGGEATEIKHTIAMRTIGKATWLWILGIRSLHNALIEDSFDKLENQCSEQTKRTPWNFWVRFLRRQLAKRSATVAEQ